MGIPVFFITFIILLTIFQIYLNKTSISRKNSRRKFWSHEEKSWFGRKSQIESDHYLHPNIENLPHLSKEDYENLGKESMFRIQEECYAIALEPMIDLTNMLNSDIRHQYGPANFDLIDTYENNYTRYIKALYILGKFFYEKDRDQDALLFLEEGVHVRTEISDHIILLGTMYCKLRDKTKFLELYERAQKSQSLTKNKIIHELKKLKEANF